MLKIFLLNLIQLICSPGHGWEDMESEEVSAYSESRKEAIRASRSGEDESEENDSPNKETAEDATDAFAGWLQHRTKRMFTCCFIPAVAICAISWFARVFYDNVSFGSTFYSLLLSEAQHALVTFVGLLLSAVLTVSIFQSVLPRLLDKHTVAWDVWRGRSINIIIYSFTFLGLVTLVSNVVKVRVALLEFLPFYVLFIIWKGCRYLQVPPNSAGPFMILAASCILGLPYLLTFLLNAVANM